MPKSTLVYYIRHFFRLCCFSNICALRYRTMATEVENNSSSKIDSILGCGLYQCLHYCLFILCTVVITINMNFMVYGKVEPEFICSEWDINLNLPKSERCSLLNQTCTNFTFEKDFHSVVVEVSDNLENNFLLIHQVCWFILFHSGG